MVRRPPAPDRAEALLETANSASQHVAVLHVAFMALCAYVLVIVFGTTDMDLLIGKGVKLPVVDVTVPIVGFYAFAPYLVVLVHFNLLLQLQLLSRKLYAFDAAASKDKGAGGPRLILPNSIQSSVHAEPKEEGIGGLRDRLHIFPYTYYLVGRPGPIVRRLLGIVVGTTLLVLPLATLLVLQLRFLAYQDQAVTWAQRIAVWLDVALVFALWPVIMDRGDSWRDYLRRVGIRLRQRSRTALAWITVWVVIVPLFATTIDGYSSALSVTAFLMALGSVVLAGLSRWWRGRRREPARVVPAAGPTVRGMPGLLLVVALGVLAWITVWVVIVPLGSATTIDGYSLALSVTGFVMALGTVVLGGLSRWWRGRRREPARAVPAAAPIVRGMPGLLLVVALGVPLPLALLADGEWWEEKLLGGNVVDSEVFYKGFRFLDLSGQVLLAKPARPALVAVFREGDPEKVKEALKQVERVKLRGRSLRSALLGNALLPGADLQGAQLQGALLVAAQLPGADLREAQLQGAFALGAQLPGADLRNAELQNMFLSLAELQGANLENAKLRGADLLRAELQGTDLTKAEFQGADLSEAQLQGANLTEAQLQGANLAKAQLKGADLRSAELYGAVIEQTDIALVDLRAARWIPLNEERLAEIREAPVKTIAVTEWRKEALERIERAGKAGLPPPIFGSCLIDPEVTPELKCRRQWLAAEISASSPASLPGPRVAWLDKLTRAKEPAGDSGSRERLRRCWTSRSAGNSAPCRRRTRTGSAIWRRTGRKNAAGNRGLASQPEKCRQRRPHHPRSHPKRRRCRVIGDAPRYSSHGGRFPIHAKHLHAATQSPARQWASSGSATLLFPRGRPDKLRGCEDEIPRNGCESSKSGSPVMMHLAWLATARLRNLSPLASRLAGIAGGAFAGTVSWLNRWRKIARSYRVW